MKKAVVVKIVDSLKKEIIDELGGENLISVSTDAIDVIIQTALDEIETVLYDSLLGDINKTLEEYSLHLDKWWE
jgi:hypothetical protein